MAISLISPPVFIDLVIQYFAISNLSANSTHSVSSPPAQFAKKLVLSGFLSYLYDAKYTFLQTDRATEKLMDVIPQTAFDICTMSLMKLLGVFPNLRGINWPTSGFGMPDAYSFSALNGTDTCACSFPARDMYLIPIFICSTFRFAPFHFTPDVL